MSDEPARLVGATGGKYAVSATDLTRDFRTRIRYVADLTATVAGQLIAEDRGGTAILAGVSVLLAFPRLRMGEISLYSLQ